MLIETRSDYRIFHESRELQTKSYFSPPRKWLELFQSSDSRFPLIRLELFDHVRAIGFLNKLKVRRGSIGIITLPRQNEWDDEPPVALVNFSDMATLLHLTLSQSQQLIRMQRLFFKIHPLMRLIQENIRQAEDHYRVTHTRDEIQNIVGHIFRLCLNHLSLQRVTSGDTGAPTRKSPVHHTSSHVTGAGGAGAGIAASCDVLISDAVTCDDLTLSSSFRDSILCHSIACDFSVVIVRRGRALQCFQVERDIGSGNYGCVNVIEELFSKNSNYIRKHAKRPKYNNTIRAEYTLLQTVNTPKKPGIQAPPSLIYMFEQNGQNLAAYIDERYSCDMTNVRIVTSQGFFNMTSQLCSGLLHLQSSSIYHGDIKPSNILYHSSKTIEASRFDIADFGGAKTREQLSLLMKPELMSLYAIFRSKNLLSRAEDPRDNIEILLNRLRSSATRNYHCSSDDNYLVDYLCGELLYASRLEGFADRLFDRLMLHDIYSMGLSLTNILTQDAKSCPIPWNKAELALVGLSIAPSVANQIIDHLQQMTSCIPIIEEETVAAPQARIQALAELYKLTKRLSRAAL